MRENPPIEKLKKRRKPRKPRKPLTEERKKELTARLYSKTAHPQQKAAATRAAQAAKKSGILERIQHVDIMEFAHIAGVSFAGRPGQELVLRLLHGMPLPEGRVKVYIRRPGEGFILDEREVSWLDYYQMLTGNEAVFETGQEKTDAYICAGARGGKTTITALETVYQGTRNKWLDYLRPKEKGYAGIVATNLDQARDLIQQACFNTLNESDLKPLIADVARREITLTNGLGIRSFPCNIRAGRGFPYFFTAYDEAGFFYLEGAKADVSIHAAINPRRMQFPRSKHIEITTPAGKQGRFYTVHSQGSQVHNRLTIQAPTWLFRPEIVALDPDFLVKEFSENPDEANREYGAEFDETLNPLLPVAETEACMILPSDAPYDPSILYAAGIDASGLSGNDRFGFAICGKDGRRNKHVVAAVRSWPDKSPDPILSDIDLLCKMYRVRLVYTDRYAKGWVHSALKAKALEPVLAPNDTETWLNTKTLIIAGKLELPMDAELKKGLMSTNVAYGTDQRPRIARKRDKHGHGDMAEAVNKAIWGSSQNIYGSIEVTHEQREAEQRVAREEEQYDALTHGRV